MLLPADACCCKEIAISPAPLQQASQADIVVVGKVVDVEPDMVMAEQYVGGGKVGHMVVNVRIQESLLGAKGLTHIRVGYVPSNQRVHPENFAFQVQRLGGEGKFWRGQINLIQGTEGCFFFQKHPTADFYVMVPMGNPIEKGESTYDAELKAVRKIVGAFEKPIEALKAKEAGDRQLAACALVHRYRQQRNNGGAVAKQEAIPAEESKLILKTLGEMKWGETPFDPQGMFSLQNVFWQFQLSENDGWRQPQPKDGEDYNAKMRETVGSWLKENAEKYRIQRMVVSPATVNGK
jgi:hypothetical protein